MTLAKCYASAVLYYAARLFRIMHSGWTVMEAAKKIAAVRPTANPNESFVAQLNALEDHLAQGLPAEQFDYKEE